jgi:hypothetical protein
MTRLMCRVRKILVADSPEERVRQEVISHLIGPAGYSPSLLAVEVSLQSLAGPSRGPVPRRRIDIVCFGPSHDGLKPLLLIECKAEMPRSSALRQVNGYNRFLQAPAVALAWPGNIVICHGGRILYQGPIRQMPGQEILDVT